MGSGKLESERVRHPPVTKLGFLPADVAAIPSQELPGGNVLEKPS